MVLTLLFLINLIINPTLASLMLLTPYLMDTFYGLSALKEAFEDNDKQSDYQAVDNFRVLEFSEIPDEKLPALNHFSPL